jgi:hypothetical protein
MLLPLNRCGSAAAPAGCDGQKPQVHCVAAHAGDALCGHAAGIACRLLLVTGDLFRVTWRVYHLGTWDTSLDFAFLLVTGDVFRVTYSLLLILLYG